MARPTKFTQELADEIADRLAEGETLKSICADAHMPNASTTFRWEIAKPEFCKLLTHAREAGSHAIIGENREIADDARNDWMEKHDKDGRAVGYVLNGEAVARSRLRIEQRWKEAEALAPRVYGKKYQVEHSGSIATGNASSEELMQELLDLLATGRVKLPGGVEIVEVEEADTPEDDDDPYGVG